MRQDRTRRLVITTGVSLGTGILAVLFVHYLTGSQELASRLPEFDGQAAFRYLTAQCDFGPRIPGTSGHAKCRDFLVKILKQEKARVSRQSFPAILGPDRKSVRASNIIARFHPNKEPRILLCAHWDTRPWADQDPDPLNRQQPLTGANDGASGVAVLLEIAGILSEEEPPVGVDIVLFDAEDLGESGSEEGWIQGSTYYANSLSPSDRPLFGILLDMIGDRDLQIFQESYSREYAREVVERVWETARSLNLPAFKPSVKYSVLDDHIPFLRVGIPCIDLIDFDYPHWHTTADTPDKCSPESLAQVGKLLVALIYGLR